MKKYIIFNADDLGQQLACNAGIQKSAAAGLLTSASLRANGLAYENALKEIMPACPHLGIGAHICLNEGGALSPSSKNSLLFDSQGNFNFIGIKGFIQIALKGIDKKFRESVKTEVRCQVEKLLADTVLDHIDGHFHIHAVPWIFRIVADIAEEYHIRFIRIPYEPLVLSALRPHFPSLLNIAHYLNLQIWCVLNKRYLHNKKVKSNDCFYGLLHSSMMNTEVTGELLRQDSAYGITEILHHPCDYVYEDKYLHDYVKDFVTSKNRQDELEALTSEKCKQIIAEKGWTLTNYSMI